MRVTMTTKQKATTRNGYDSIIEHGYRIDAYLDHVDCNDCLGRMVMTLRDMLVEYIYFAYTPEDLAAKFGIFKDELEGLADVDLLEIYDQTLLGVVAE